MQAEPVERLLTTNELAELLGMSPRTIRAWQANGEIPYVKICGSVRYVPSKIAAWIEECSSKNYGSPF